MSLGEIILIAIGLSMDAFAVAVAKGITMKNFKLKKAVIIGLYFGIFQAIMPLIGFFIGIKFQSFVSKLSNIIGFLLLTIIGINMIKESKNESKKMNDKIDFKTMILLSIATSIDALSVGITFALFNINIFTSSLIIGIITFLFSLDGVKIGFDFGNKFANKAQIIGGTILIIIGIKILILH